MERVSAMSKKPYKPKSTKKSGVTLLDVSTKKDKAARQFGLPVVQKPKPLETPQRKALRRAWVGD